MDSISNTRVGGAIYPPFKAITNASFESDVIVLNYCNNKYGLKTRKIRLIHITGRKLPTLYNMTLFTNIVK
jgi:hypothetical protein